MKKLIIIISMIVTAMAGPAQQLKQFTLEDLNFGGKNYRNMTPKRLRLWWDGNKIVNSGRDAQEEEGKYRKILGCNDYYRASCA